MSGSLLGNNVVVRTTESGAGLEASEGGVVELERLLIEAGKLEAAEYE